MNDDIKKVKAINIKADKVELSTQEAVSLLNVSRSYLIKLLENSETKYHQVSSHRKVLSDDVLEYKQRIDSNCLKN